MPPAADTTVDLGGNPWYFAAGMADVGTDDDWLTGAEADRLRRFRYTKRRDEARLGRWTAKHAVAAAYGMPTDSGTLRSLAITNAADGAPEVFIGGERAPLHISMTDRADWAVCMVTDLGGGGIGCDLEIVEPRTSRFVDDWFTPTEREAVAARPDQHDELANLIWSAKESALKVLRTGLRRDTRTVEVRFADDIVDGWGVLSVTPTEGERFPGWWRRFGEFVLTFAGTVDTDPPASLVDPSPLHGAIPTHSWMSNPGTD